MTFRRILSGLMAFIIACEPLLAENFYTEKEILKSNIMDSDQLFKAYLENKEYTQGLAPRGATADAFIRAPEGSKTDVILRGDAETMRLESLIAETLFTTAPKKDFQVNEDIRFSIMSQLCVTSTDSEGTIKLNVWLDEKNFKEKSILYIAKNLNLITYSSTVDSIIGCSSVRVSKLTDEQKQYIKEEHLFYNPEGPSIRKEEKKEEEKKDSIYTRFIKRDIDGKNDLRQKDRAACLGTVLLTSAFKKRATENKSVSWCSLKRELTRSQSLPSNIAKRFSDDSKKYKNLLPFLQRKVFLLLSKEGYFAHYWKASLAKQETPKLKSSARRTLDSELPEDFEPLIKFRNYYSYSYSETPPIRKDWDTLSKDEKSKRLEEAKIIASKLEAPRYGCDDKNLPYMIAVMPPQISRIFDKSLGLLPENKYDVSEIQKQYTDYKKIIEAKSAARYQTDKYIESAVDFARKIPVNIFLPRLNNTQTYSLDDVVVPTLQKEMDNKMNEFVREIERFFKNFNFTDDKASNYLSVALVAGDYEENLIGYGTLDERAMKIKEKFLEKAKKVFDCNTNQAPTRDIHAVTYDIGLFKYMQKFFLKLTSRLKEFNDDFTSTASGTDFIAGLSNLFTTFNNCHGGMSEACKNAADALFFKKATTKLGGGEERDKIDSFAHGFVRETFKNSGCTSADVHEKGQLANFFRRKGIHNADESVSERADPLYTNISEKMQAFVFNVGGISLAEAIHNQIEPNKVSILKQSITDMKAILSGSVTAKENLFKRENAPEDLKAAKEAKEVMDGWYKASETLKKLSEKNKEFKEAFRALPSFILNEKLRTCIHNLI